MALHREAEDGKGWTRRLGTMEESKQNAALVGFVCALNLKALSWLGGRKWRTKNRKQGFPHEALKYLLMFVKTVLNQMEYDDDSLIYEYQSCACY